MEKEKKIENILLSKIFPDEKQPRKNFNALRLADLRKSIKTHGILSPLFVEKRKDNYLLVDGERRYRAAKDLKMKMVPVVVTEDQSDTQRLVQQFHLQEQHEGWSSVEKAQAVIRLSDELKMSVHKLAELLSLPRRTVEEYVAYSKLLSVKQFTKSEIPLHFVTCIMSLRRFTKKVVLEVLEKEFTHDEEKKLELAIIARIKVGEIRTREDVNKIRDSVKQNPKDIYKFIEDSNMTANALFLKTKAQVARFYRRSVQNATYLQNQLDNGMPLGIVHHYNNSTKNQNVIRRLHHTLGIFINKFEDKLD